MGSAVILKKNTAFFPLFVVSMLRVKSHAAAGRTQVEKGSDAVDGPRRSASLGFPDGGNLRMVFCDSHTQEYTICFFASKRLGD